MGDLPHHNNACSGKYDDWLEVMLTPECNGTCSWCVEKRGWHPTKHAHYLEITKAAHAAGKKNIILLGGEPTLHEHIGDISRWLRLDGHNVWITTNGSRLTEAFVDSYLQYMTGVNISIHSTSLYGNEGITGIQLHTYNLKYAITAMHKHGTKVRLNCNCIDGFVDSFNKMLQYVRFAKELGAGSVRFAELKFDDEQFVDFTKIMPSFYVPGINGDPYTMGCSVDAILLDTPVNFRQMCGLQTRRRPRPKNPEQCPKQVLYYDGNIYNGWQLEEEDTVEDKKLIEVLENVKAGRVSVAEAALAIARETSSKPRYRHEYDKPELRRQIESHCHY